MRQPTPTPPLRLTEASAALTHTVDVVTAADWTRAYSRQQAAFPAAWQQRGKNKTYWPTVGRVDNVHGDRNLVCSCPPLESYQE